MIDNQVWKAKDGTKIENAKADMIGKLAKQIIQETGAAAFNDAEEMKLFIESIKRSFGYWCIEEIKLALTLAMAGNIQAEVKSYGKQMSAVFISELMKAYRTLKATVISKWKSEEPVQDIPEEEKERIIAGGVQRIFDAYLKEESSLLLKCYVWHPYTSYLKRSGRLSYDDATWGVACTTGLKIGSKLETSDNSIRRMVAPNPKDQKLLAERFANYVILKAYFDKCKILNERP